MAMAESLRKPALASRTFRADCSNSVCGINGCDSALAFSTMLCRRSPFFCCGSSISAREAGRLNRARRSWARLLRWESIDRMVHTPMTKQANTRSGMMAVSSRKPRITGASPHSGVRLHLDVHDLLDHDGAQHLHDQRRNAHFDAQRIGPQ